MQAGVHQLVTQINGRYGTLDHAPVQFINANVDKVALLCVLDRERCAWELRGKGEGERVACLRSCMSEACLCGSHYAA